MVQTAKSVDNPTIQSVASLMT